MAFHGRTAIVTGGALGLGRTISKRLARDGANIVLAGRTTSALEEVATHIEGAGGAALAVPTDISNEGQVDAMVDAAIQRFGSVDILVNNAGRVGLHGDFLTLPSQEWLESYSVNLMGALHCSRAVLKLMMPQRSGAIINISSIAGSTGFLPGMPYSESKAALNMLTTEIARYAAPAMVRVNALLLGPIELGKAGVRSFRGEVPPSGSQMWATFGMSVPPGGMLLPGEIASTVSYLASDEAVGITGQHITMVSRLKE